MSGEDKTKIINKVSANFKTSIIKDTLRINFTNPKTRLSDEAVDLVAEVAKAMTVEAAIRAARQANMESCKTVTLDHTESILTQMMLDFP